MSGSVIRIEIDVRVSAWTYHVPYSYEQIVFTLVGYKMDLKRLIYTEYIESVTTCTNN